MQIVVSTELSLPIHWIEDRTNKLYVFLFTESTGGPGILREVKYLNKPENTPKDELYQWEWLPNGTSGSVIPLTFVSSSSDTLGENMCSRMFKEGKLVFSKESKVSVFTFDTNHYTLERKSMFP